MAPRLTAARRCCKDGPHIQPGGFAIFLSQDWTCLVTIAGLDVVQGWCRGGAGVVQGWCIHTVGLGTVHRPGPLEHMHAAACSKPQPHAAAHARRPRCCSCLGDEPTPSPRVAAVARLAPPLPSWRGVGSAQPARLPLFPSPAVADQATGVPWAGQLRAREALQPDTLGPISALGPGAVLVSPCQLVEEGRGRIWRHGWLSRTRCRGRGLFEWQNLCFAGFAKFRYFGA
jgi:hypothetical protein